MEKFNPPSKTFCALPWIHLSTRTNGKLRACCTANASSVTSHDSKKYEAGTLKTEDGKAANLNTTDLLTAWNSSYMKNIRTKMLNGEVPQSCTKCFDEEKSGYISKRNWETDYWSKKLDIKKIVSETKADGEVEPKLYYLDLRFGTKCNLKCVMCSPHDSSLWISDWKKMFPEVKDKQLKRTMDWGDKEKEAGASYNWHKNNPVFWDQLFSQIPHMKQLYFAGGEPTIIEEHYMLLEECVKRGYAKNIELRYNSNGLELPDRLFNLWKEFESVRFHFSIDGYGKINDYIRYPSKWEDIEKNLWRLELDSPDNVVVTIAFAVQALNIFYIPEFVKWKIQQGFKKISAWPTQAGLIAFHFVHMPAHLNVKILPSSYKDKCEEKFNELYSWLEQNWLLSGSPSKEEFLKNNYSISRLRSLISFMKSDDWSNRLTSFQEYIKLLDNTRGHKFSEYFPELDNDIRRI